MTWYAVFALLFGLLVLLLLVGVPVAFSLMSTGIVGILALDGAQGLMSVASTAYGAADNFVLLSIPLFILMAEIVSFTGLSADAFDALNRWLDRFPGRLLLATVGVGTIFAGITGSSIADAATIGRVAVPEMAKRGYDMRLAVGTVVGVGPLGILIPPSMLMIVYGVITQQPVGQLFMAGLLPGLLTALMFCIYIITLVSLKPELAPRLPTVSWRDRLESLPKLVPLLLLMLVVLGVIYLGVATATEAAAIGSFGAICLAAAFSKLNWSNLREAILGTTRVTSYVTFLLIGSAVFGVLLTRLEIPQHLTSFILSLTPSTYGLLIGISILYFMLGCFLDPATILMLSVPIFLPVFNAMHIDLIWFGIIAVINMEVANITPPVGLVLYVGADLVKPYGMRMEEVFRGAIPFMLIHIVTMAIVMIFPSIVLWLPSLMVR